MARKKQFHLSIFFLFLLFWLAFPKSARAASLSLSPATGEVGLNQTFPVEVILDTAGSNSDSADVILKYDEGKLSIVSSILGELYDNKAKNDTGVLGKVTLRAYSSPGTFYNGHGTFATLTFKAKAAGSAVVSFDFTANSTKDCNVSLSKVDILTSVTGAAYTIMTPLTPTATVVPSQPPVPTRPPVVTQPPPPSGTQIMTPTPRQPLPKSGGFKVTVGTGVLGILFLALASMAILL
jgi:hypothetical protein